MYYNKKDENNVREVFLPDRITHKNRHDFIVLIERFTRSEIDTLVLNFKDTTMIDSAALGFMLIARQEISKCQRHLILKNPTRYVKKMFKVLNFDSIFTIENDE